MVWNHRPIDFFYFWRQKLSASSILLLAFSKNCRPPPRRPVEHGEFYISLNACNSIFSSLGRQMYLCLAVGVDHVLASIMMTKSSLPWKEASEAWEVYGNLKYESVIFSLRWQELFSSRWLPSRSKACVQWLFIFMLERGFPWQHGQKFIAVVPGFWAQFEICWQAGLMTLKHFFALTGSSQKQLTLACGRSTCMVGPIYTLMKGYWL